MTGIDKKPVKFVLKVYETKELAEIGDENNALYIFANGIGDESFDETVANGSQSVTGSATTGSTGATLKDSEAKFGSRLVGKKLKNNDSSATDPTTTSGQKEGIVSTRVSETELTIDTNLGFLPGHKYIFDSPSNFFTFQKYFYRFESTDVVNAFIVDWDDGEDNSPEKANRQTIKLDSPGYYAVTSHTYTTHGLHFPMIRTINTEGFYSKWYTPYDAQASGLKSIETQTLPQIQNSFSKVSLDKPTIPRIPSFAPANSPPIGVLKTDRSVIYSGIDNLPFEEGAVASPLVYCYVERKVDAGGVNLTGYTERIQVVWEDTTNQIRKSIVSAHSTIATIISGTTYTIGTAGAGGPHVKRILSAKLLNLSEATTDAEKASMLAADERVILYGMEQGGTEDPSTDPVITILSLGNPLQYLDRPGFYATLDGSQSQTRCSNVDIDSYIFDTGRLEGLVDYTTGAAGLYYGVGYHEQISDILGIPLGEENTFSQSDSSLKVSYTFSPNTSVRSSSSGNVIDKTTMRFFNEERLVRLQVIDSSATTRSDASRPFVSTDDSAANLAENLNGTETEIDVTDLSKFNIGDVISLNAVILIPTNEQMYVSDIGDGSGAGTLTVSRQYNGTNAFASGLSGDDIFILNDDGILGDSSTHSFVEHWNRDKYSDFVTRPDSYKSRALLMYSTDSDPSNPLGVITWKAKDDDYLNNTRIQVASATDEGELGLIFGGAKHTAVGGDSSNGTQLVASTSAGLQAPNPSNYLLMCKTKKFNKIHLRMKNNFKNTVGTTEPTSDTIWPTDGHKVQLYLWYTARESPASSTYRWKALSFRDGTSCRTYDANDTENNSLRVSGSISFDMPSDWVDVKSSDLTWDGASKPITDEDDDVTIIDPAGQWIDNMYGLMLGIGIASDGSPVLPDWRCVSVQSYNNAHSQAMTIIDPHHKSLNDIAIAQSISWSRSGKYIDISNRMGSTEIRKIGAEGGSITFGGVELSGNYDTQKKVLNIYQREGIPVYLDVQRAVDKGEYIRFYGVLTDMSEDYPAGMQTPKFGLTMMVSHVCEYDRNNNTASTSNWIGKGIMSLGGEIIDVTDFAP